MKTYKTYSIGRDSDNDIFFDEHTSQRSLYISSHHAVLKVTIWGKYYINDFSTNGTTVNGHRIASNQDIEVRRGDSIVFGGVDGAGELDWSMVARPRTPIYIAVAVALALIVLLLMINKCQDDKSPSPAPVVDGVPVATGGSSTKAKKDTTKKDSTYTYKDKKQKKEKATDENGQDVAGDEAAKGGDSFLDKFLHQKAKKTQHQPAQQQGQSAQRPSQPAAKQKGGTQNTSADAKGSQANETNKDGSAPSDSKKNEAAEKTRIKSLQ